MKQSIGGLGCLAHSGSMFGQRTSNGSLSIDGIENLSEM